MNTPFLYYTRDKNVRKKFCPGSEARRAFPKNRDFAIQGFCPSNISLLNIVARPNGYSRAGIACPDFLSGHPDVTLESGLVLNTNGQL